MKLNKQEVEGSRGLRLILKEGDKNIARAYLYLINNSLHKEPYGLLEDMFVEEEYRGRGFGKKMMDAVIKEAKKLGCYKLIAQSRYSREKAHSFYKKFGFTDHGKNFRMDL